MCIGAAWVIRGTLRRDVQKNMCSEGTLVGVRESKQIWGEYVISKIICVMKDRAGGSGFKVVWVAGRGFVFLLFQWAWISPGFSVETRLARLSALSIHVRPVYFSTTNVREGEHFSILRVIGKLQ